MMAPSGVRAPLPPWLSVEDIWLKHVAPIQKGPSVAVVIADTIFHFNVKWIIQLADSVPLCETYHLRRYERRMCRGALVRFRLNLRSRTDSHNEQKYGCAPKEVPLNNMYAPRSRSALVGESKRVRKSIVTRDEQLDLDRYLPLGA